MSQTSFTSETSKMRYPRQVKGCWHESQEQLGRPHHLLDGNSDIDRHLLLLIPGMFGALTLQTTD